MGGFHANGMNHHHNHYHYGLRPNYYGGGRYHRNYYGYNSFLPGMFLGFAASNIIGSIYQKDNDYDEECDDNKECDGGCNKKKIKEKSSSSKNKKKEQDDDKE